MLSKRRLIRLRGKGGTDLGNAWGMISERGARMDYSESYAGGQLALTWRVTLKYVADPAAIFQIEVEGRAMNVTAYTRITGTSWGGRGGSYVFTLEDYR